jgi:hypothetical protein
MNRYRHNNKSEQIEQTEQIKFIVPAYFYPGTNWARLINAAKYNDNIIAIANCNNGAGNKIDKKYSIAFDKFTDNGGRIVGYVYTQYGNRNIDKVKKDIDKWFLLYGKYVSGIFLDEQDISLENIEYYKTLYNYIKDNYHVIVIGNCGYAPHENYMQFNDITCIHENDNAKIRSEKWMSKYNSDKFYMIVHSYNNYKSAIKTAKNNNIGYIYCTDDKLPNPFDVLPEYFEDMIR